MVEGGEVTFRSFLFHRRSANRPIDYPDSLQSWAFSMLNGFANMQRDGIVLFTLQRPAKLLQSPFFV